MTLFETVFSGNDAVYGLTENAINSAIEQYALTKLSAFQTQHTACHVTMQ